MEALISEITENLSKVMENLSSCANQKVFGFQLSSICEKCKKNASNVGITILPSDDILYLSLCGECTDESGLSLWYTQWKNLINEIEKKFPDGMKVKRSSGEIQSGWTIGGHFWKTPQLCLIKDVLCTRVVHVELDLEKHIPVEELLEWNQ